MSALYRTYRPQTFNQVIGQENIKTTLENAIIHQRVVHSYLFCGPRGTGKTTLARILAKSLNCLDRPAESAEPCNLCANCQAINSNSFIDLVEIDAASNRGIDEIRNLKEAVRFAPSQKNGYKIYIIDEVHMLTKEAANALLKTLEEPPQHTIFILATTDTHKILPTILSRVQRFNFTPLSATELQQKLEFIIHSENLSIDQEVIHQIILQAMGGARDAESILGKLIRPDITHISEEFAASILGKNPYRAAYQILEYLAAEQLYETMTSLHQLYDQGYAMDQLTLNLIQISHNLFLAQINSELLDKSSLLEFEFPLLLNLAPKFHQAKLIRFITELEQIKSNLYAAYLPYLPLELCMASIWANPSQGGPTAKNRSDLKSKTSAPDLRVAKTPNIEPSQTDRPQNTRAAEPAAQTLPQKAEVTAEIVQKKYLDIHKALAKQNKSLAIIFSKTQVINLVEKHITIAVESDFYRSRLEKQASLITSLISQSIQIPVDQITFITQKIDLSQAFQPKGNPNNNNQTTSSSDMNETIADIFKEVI